MRMETLYETRRDLAKRSVEEFEGLEKYYKEALPIAVEIARVEGTNPMSEIMRVIETGIKISVDMHKDTYKFYDELLNR